MSLLADFGIGLAGDLLGSAIKGGVSSAFNAQMMEKQHALNKDLFDYTTQHRYQNTVKDLRAAGLNPILAYGGLAGASAGTSVGLVGADTNSQSSALSTQMEMQRRQMKQQQPLIDAQSKQATAAAELAGSQQAQIWSRMINEFAWNAQQIKESESRIAYNAGKLANETRFTDGQITSLLGNLAVNQQNAATNAYDAETKRKQTDQWIVESAERALGLGYDNVGKGWKAGIINGWQNSGSPLNDVYEQGALARALLTGGRF